MDNNFFNDKNTKNSFNFFNNSSSENIFDFQNNEPQKTNEVKIKEQYSNIKDNYKDIFVQAANSIRKTLKEFEPVDACEKCKIKDCVYRDKSKDPFWEYPDSCEYKSWQFKIITYLTTEYKSNLKKEFKKLMDKKLNYSCNKCASCCKLATSEFSYEQLRQKAYRGDKFALDFVSVFVPYKTEQEARNNNPDYFELFDLLGIDDNVYFYYCPKLNGNLCSDYENRPDVCKNFPNNPYKLLPSKCAFNVWKNEINEEALLLNAKMDLIDYYKKGLS